MKVFMKWNSSSVLKSDTKDYNGQHAYHAIVVTGYDDSKELLGCVILGN